mmetsp:Transcript_25848/g.33429  ORF Transcript_25848/g.33429 Transcript_25848/m.33429 type:complete len:84 (-) Transcript_25848:228-479(-)
MTVGGMFELPNNKRFAEDSLFPISPRADDSFFWEDHHRKKKLHNSSKAIEIEATLESFIEPLEYIIVISCFSCWNCPFRFFDG